MKGILAIVGVSLFALGCSSTGRFTPNAITAPQTVRLPTYVHPQLTPYVGRFASVLEGAGFVLGPTSNPAALTLQLDFNPNPFKMRVTASLVQRGVVIASGQGTNSGWGTVLAEDAAIGDLVERAARELQSQLASAAPAMTIVADVDESRPQEASRRPNGPASSSAVGTGTGFTLINASSLVTAYHVIEGASRIEAKCGGSGAVQATVEKIDPANDLALLSLSLRASAFLDLAADGSVRTGQQVFTIGFPVPEVLGSEPKYSDGSISSTTGIGGASNLLQTSVPVQPGNSGGPLVDLNGRVVGVVTSSAAVKEFLRITGTLPQNVNWAVRSEYLRPLIASLQHGSPIAKASAVDRVKDSACLVIAYQ